MLTSSQGFPAQLSVLISPDATTTLDCDFTGDFACTVDDINELLSQGDLVSGIGVPPGSSEYDLDSTGNPNSLIDNVDLDEWLAQAATENGFGTSYRRGDIELDREVDIMDFENFLNGFTGLSDTWAMGNFDGDSNVDITDFSNYFLPSFSATAGGSYGPRQAIPEPSTVLLLGFGGLLLLCISVRMDPALNLSIGSTMHAVSMVLTALN